MTAGAHTGAKYTFTANTTGAYGFYVDTCFDFGCGMGQTMQLSLTGTSLAPNAKHEIPNAKCQMQMPNVHSKAATVQVIADANAKPNSIASQFA